MDAVIILAFVLVPSATALITAHLYDFNWGNPPPAPKAIHRPVPVRRRQGAFGARNQLERGPLMHFTPEQHLDVRDFCVQLSRERAKAARKFLTLARQAHGQRQDRAASVFVDEYESFAELAVALRDRAAQLWKHAQKCT